MSIPKGGRNGQSGRFFRQGKPARIGRLCGAVSGAVANESAGGAPLPFDSLAQLRQKLFAEHPVFAELDQPLQAKASEWQGTEGGLDLSPEPFAPVVADFYRTDSISRVSETMARCSAVRQAARSGEAERIVPQEGSPLFALATPQAVETANGSLRLCLACPPR